MKVNHEIRLVMSDKIADQLTDYGLKYSYSSSSIIS